MHTRGRTFIISCTKLHTSIPYLIRALNSTYPIRHASAQTSKRFLLPATAHSSGHRSVEHIPRAACAALSQASVLQYQAKPAISSVSAVPSSRHASRSRQRLHDGIEGRACPTCGLRKAFGHGPTSSCQPLPIRRVEPANPPRHSPAAANAAVTAHAVLHQQQVKSHMRPRPSRRPY